MNPRNQILIITHDNFVTDAQGLPLSREHVHDLLTAVLTNYWNMSPAQLKALHDQRLRELGSSYVEQFSTTEADLS